MKKRNKKNFYVKSVVASEDKCYTYIIQVKVLDS